jgi:seryl-tRNA(Sec) selenium transferase
MTVTNLFDRRYFVKLAGAAPLLAYIAAQDMAEKAWGAVGKHAGKENVYSRIGVRPFINGRGTWTYLSGSLELPEVRAAKQAASQHFVDIFELQHAAGRRLAELSGAEFGMVTSGAAGAMASATAACMAGIDPAKIWQLPDTTGLKHEVIMYGGRSAFDSAIRLTGAKLVVARTHDELRSAINDSTAMIYTTALGDTLEKALAIAKEAKVPMLLDDAAGIPPIENLKLYSKMGLDLYCFSGGKGLAGPQCSGLLLGRKDLIEAAMANTSPWEGAVCRAMKVGKEEIMGCLAAVEAWTHMDLNALNRQWNERAVRIQKLIDTVPGVKTDIQIPVDGNRYPTLIVTWDEPAWSFTVADCDKQLREGEPRIEVLTSSNPSLVSALKEDHNPKTPKSADRLEIVSMTLQPGEDLIVGKRLRDILTQARKGAKAA